MRDGEQIPIPTVRTAPRRWLGAIAILLSLPAASQAASMMSLSGKILGLVTDAAGVPQMGASVVLLNAEDKVGERVLTDERGAFTFDGLIAGRYSVRVSLASFMPVSKSNIFVQPGLRTLLNVSLAGLFRSIQLVSSSDEQRAEMNNNWSWVLSKTNEHNTRCVLRRGD